MAVGLVNIGAEDVIHVIADGLQEGNVNPAAVERGLSHLPGGAEALQLLKRNPRADIASVGSIIKAALNAHKWKDVTTAKVGKDFRSWARQAGLDLPWAQTSEVTDDDES